MARMTPRTYRVRRSGNAVMTSFADGTRAWDVVLPIERATELAGHLTAAVALSTEDPKTLGGPPSEAPDRRYKLEFRAYDDGHVGFVIIAPAGELEVPTTIAEAEVLLAKLADTIAAAKRGPPRTKQ